MRKLFLPLICFLLLAFVSSTSGVIIIRTSPPAGGGGGDMCSSCPDDAAGGDLMCDDFEGTGFVCSGWDTHSTIYDADNTPTGSWACNETNSQNLEITYQDGDRVDYDFGRTTSPNYAVFYFKVTSESMSNGGEVPVAFGRDQDNTLYVWILYIAQDGSGNLYFYMSNRNDSNGYTDKNVGSPTTYTLGDEVRVRIDHDATAGSGTSTYYIKVGSASEDTVSFTEDETDDNEHFGHIAFGWGGADDDYTAEYDFLRVDDDTMPAACSGDSY